MTVLSRVSPVLSAFPNSSVPVLELVEFILECLDEFLESIRFPEYV